MQPTILVLHGAFEHAGRYAPLHQALQAAGYTVVAPNLRGHGPQPGKVVHVTDLAAYVDDAQVALQAAGVAQPDAIVAHSMGGLVALLGLVQQRWQPRLTILLSPFLDTAKPVPAPVVALAKGLHALTFGLLRLPTGVQGRYLTHDTALQQAHRADPLIRKSLSVPWFLAVRRAQALVLAAAPQLHSPLALLSAGDDRVVSLAKQQAFAQALPTGTMRYHHTYPAAYHELLNETNRAEVLQQVLALLQEALANIKEK
jgi:lysophospholipase